MDKAATLVQKRMGTGSVEAVSQFLQVAVTMGEATPSAPTSTTAMNSSSRDATEIPLATRNFGEQMRAVQVVKDAVVAERYDDAATVLNASLGQALTVEQWTVKLDHSAKVLTGPVLSAVEQQDWTGAVEQVTDEINQYLPVDPEIANDAVQLTQKMVTTTSYTRGEVTETDQPALELPANPAVKNERTTDKPLINPPASVERQISTQPESNFFEAATEQVGGFFTGVGEVAVETVEGVASLASSAVKTAYDLSPADSLVDAGEWIAETVTGEDLTRPEWMPDSDRGMERVNKGVAVIEAIIDDPGKLIDAVVEPIKEDWEAGRQGEVIGRGVAEVVSVVLGTKGIDKVAKEGKVADAVGDVAKVSDVAAMTKNVDLTGNVGKVVGGLIELDPKTIRTTQTTTKQQGATLQALTESMKKNGFVVEPDKLIDVVRMQDGRLTSLDNTRIVAADLAEVKIQARVSNFDDLLPDNQQFISRFVGRKGEVPKTFGDAVENRVRDGHGITSLFGAQIWFVLVRSD